MTSTDALDVRLRDGDGPGAATLSRLRTRLAERADRDGMVDVAYRIVASPAGDLLLAATDAGVVKVAFQGPEEGALRAPLDVTLDRLAHEISPRLLHLPGRLDDAARQLDDYFAGRRRRFELNLDLRLARGFRRQVLDHLREVPFGTTISYAGLAAAAGSPRAVRAVGTACATNPLPIVIPCHRVVRSDGGIGGYGGGPAVKRALLDLEAAA